MSEWQVLVLQVSPELQDSVVDMLIEFQGISGFEMHTVAGYSREHSRFNTREQVAGYRQILRFEVVHEASMAESLLLSEVSSNDRMRYWTLPTLSQGHIPER